MYQLLNKMSNAEKQAILEQADTHLRNLQNLWLSDSYKKKEIFIKNKSNKSLENTILFFLILWHKLKQTQLCYGIRKI